MSASRVQRQVFAATLVLIATLISGACAPAGPAGPATTTTTTVPSTVVVTDDAHLDVFSIDYDGDTLRLRIDHASELQLLDPATSVVHVRPASRGVIGSNPLFAFLGPAGGSVWTLDGGWSVHGVPAGQFINDRLQIRLLSVSGPGNVGVWKYTSLADPNADLASSAPLPQVLEIARTAHSHRNWSFTAEGNYTVQAEVTAVLASNGQQITSGVETYTFVVGPYPAS